MHRYVRAALQNAISSNRPLPTVSVDEVVMHLPVSVGDFTDFCASREHILNVGEVMSGQRVLPPVFLSFPIRYAGRSSSIVVSGTPVERPVGQFTELSVPNSDVVCAPSRMVDFELEVGAIIGQPVGPGKRANASGARSRAAQRLEWYVSSPCCRILVETRSPLIPMEQRETFKPTK